MEIKTQETTPGIQEPVLTDEELAKWREQSQTERQAAAQQQLGHNALVGFSDGTVGTPADAQEIITNEQDRPGAYDGHGRE